MKGYIVRWKSRKEDDHRTIDYWFSESFENAAAWFTQELAEIDVLHFNQGITIPSALGGSYVLREFQIEEYEPGKFVVWCEGPFIVSKPGTRMLQENGV